MGSGHSLPSCPQLNPGISPLGGKDPIEEGLAPILRVGVQGEDILEHVKGKAVVGPGAQELSLEEGGPALLQHPLSTLIALQGKRDHGLGLVTSRG